MRFSARERPTLRRSTSRCNPAASSWRRSRTAWGTLANESVEYLGCMRRLLRCVPNHLFQCQNAADAAVDVPRPKAVEGLREAVGGLPTPCQAVGGCGEQQGHTSSEQRRQLHDCGPKASD